MGHGLGGKGKHGAWVGRKGEAWGMGWEERGSMAWVGRKQQWNAVPTCAAFLEDASSKEDAASCGG